MKATNNTVLFSAMRENGTTMDAAGKLRADGSTQATQPRLPRPGDSEWVDLVPSRTGAWWYNQTDSLDGVDWTAPGYQESGNCQSAGTTEFWYSDTENGTQLGEPSGSRSTYYFRKHFSLTQADLAAADFLILKVLHDDGCAVWLNGAEVGRSNLAPGAGYYYQQMYAVGDPNDDPYEDIFLQFVVSKSLLVTGDNVLASALHGLTSSGSKDLGFDLSLHAIKNSWWPGQ